MQFIDETEIHAASGDGGPGMMSFHTARNKPKLGPDGGNGGLGGSLVLLGDRGLNTLSNYRYKQSFRAENGGKGGSNNKTGRCGEHLVLRMPIGTVVFDAGSNTKICELLDDKTPVIIAKGGKRGYGNLAFVSALRRAPRISTPGEKGEAKQLRLELKLLADVGLAGFPNAGKSSLLAALSAARPKVADYPFTTLTPQLGVIETQNFGGSDESFVIADIPGLIEGASEGKGLGHQFLRHLERTKLIAYVVDVSEHDDIEDKIRILKNELATFSPEFAKRDALLVLNKIDALQDSENPVSREELTTRLAPFGMDMVFISALKKEGLKELVFKLWDKILQARSLEEQELV